jgi:ATP-dependent Clp protease protease subunit
MKSEQIKILVIDYVSYIGEINLDNVKDFIQKMDDLKKTDSGKVQITLTTLGGYIVSAIALYDYLKSYPKIVEIVVMGCCHSCGLLVLQAGTKRLSYLHTRFMFHHAMFDIQNQKYLKDLKSTVGYYEQLQDMFFELTTKQSHLSKEEFMQLCNSEYYFDANKALEFGLIDDVLH